MSFGSGLMCCTAPARETGGDDKENGKGRTSATWAWILGSFYLDHGSTLIKRKCQDHDMFQWTSGIKI
eukprot:scaffold83640_cov15-Tisochrysis_lutea.AAC.3